MTHECRRLCRDILILESRAKFPPEPHVSLRCRETHNAGIRISSIEMLVIGGQCALGMHVGINVDTNHM